MSNLANAGKGFYSARPVAKIQVAEVAADEQPGDVFGGKRAASSLLAEDRKQPGA